MGETFNSFMNSIARAAPLENDWDEDNAGEWRFFTGEPIWGPSFDYSATDLSHITDMVR